MRYLLCRQPISQSSCQISAVFLKKNNVIWKNQTSQYLLEIRLQLEKIISPIENLIVEKG